MMELSRKSPTILLAIALCLGGTLAVAQVGSEDPLGERPEFRITAIEPAPCPEPTLIRFLLPEAGRLRVIIYDVRGRRILVIR